MSSASAKVATNPAPEPGGNIMTNFEVFSKIVTVIELFSQVPKLASIIKQVGVNTVAFLKSPGPSLDPNSPLKVFLDAESERLRALIEEYNAIHHDPRYSDLDKDKHRKKLVAQICALLKGLDAVSEMIAEYRKMRALFCESLSRAL